MKKLLTFLIIVLVSINVSAQKRAFTIEDLYKVKNVGSPVLSPDGKDVVFSVTKYNLKKAKSYTDIFRMDVNGKNLRKLTNNKSADFNPIFSKDGKGLYFVSYRSGKGQLYYLPLDGGEAKQITNYPLGISYPKISQDEKFVIFTAKMFPEANGDAEKSLEIRKSIKKGPVHAHIADSLFVRHWTEYNDGEYSNIILYDIDKDEYKDLTPGAYHSPAFSPGGSGQFQFSPDGKQIVFTSKRVKDPEFSTNVDIWIVNIDGSGLRNITKNNEAADVEPAFSPDGRYIAYKKQVIPRYESDRFRLAIFDLKENKEIVLTENFDNWVGDYKWNESSDEIYFTADVEGYHPLFKVDINSKEIEKVIEKSVIYGFDFKDDYIVFNNRSVAKPAELYKWEDDEVIQLTNFNKKLTDEVDIRPAEQVWYEGAGGRKIHMFIVKPHGFDPNKKYPVIINVHGGPQFQWMDSFRGDWQVYPGAGYIVAFPNPHGSTGYGQEFTAAISGDWAGKVYEDVMKAADYLETLPYVDKDRMGAMGWSYGGYFMNLLQGTTKRFKCLASMMGIYDLPSFYLGTEELWFPEWDLKGNPFNSELYKKHSPSTMVENFSTPTLIITGERDYRIPYTQSLQYFTTLQLKGIESRLIIFDNDGHWPSHLYSMPLYYNAHLEWFHKYLGGGKAPWDSRELSRNRIFNNKKE